MRRRAARRADGRRRATDRRAVCVGVDAYGGIYFKTKWLKKAFDDFDIGAKFGYSYTASQGSQWLVNGTINNFLVNDLPPVKIDNLYFQLSFLFKYNFVDMTNKKKN